jgi:hypothetical protein
VRAAGGERGPLNDLEGSRVNSERVRLKSSGFIVWFAESVRRCAGPGDATCHF